MALELLVESRVTFCRSGHSGQPDQGLALGRWQEAGQGLGLLPASTGRPEVRLLSSAFLFVGGILNPFLDSPGVSPGPRTAAEAGEAAPGHWSWVGRAPRVGLGGGAPLARSGLFSWGEDVGSGVC